MQLIHSITLTGVVLLSSASALFHYREKPLRDVAIVSGLLCAVSASKLADPQYTEQFKAVSKGIWVYLSTM